MTNALANRVATDIYPIETFAYLRIRSDGTHPWAKIGFASRESLLHDSMLVDAVFHMAEDPFHEFYPTLDTVIATLGNKRSHEVLVRTLDHLQETTDDLYKKSADAFVMYAEGRMPPVLVRQLVSESFEGFQQYSFPNHEQNVDYAAGLAKKQLEFVRELLKIKPGNELELAVELYQRAFEVFERQRIEVNRMYAAFNAAVARNYEGQPAPTRGASPTFTLSALGFLGDIDMQRRPAFWHAVREAREVAVDELEAALRQLALANASRGVFALRHDLR